MALLSRSGDGVVLCPTDYSELILGPMARASAIERAGIPTLVTDRGEVSIPRVGLDAAVT